MNSLFEGLREWDVPEDRIHYEAFGPATVGKKKEADKLTEDAADSQEQTAQEISVTFSRSGKTVAWDSDAHSLLRFALDNGIVIDHSCEAGNCGTCTTALISGEIKYMSDPAEPAQSGSCYTCITVPDGPIDLDA